MKGLFALRSRGNAPPLPSSPKHHDRSLVPRQPMNNIHRRAAASFVQGGASKNILCGAKRSNTDLESGNHATRQWIPSKWIHDETRPPTTRSHSNTKTALVNTTSSTTENSEPPLLLLEGDTLVLSRDGISRVFYQLVDSSDNNNNHTVPQSIAMEEQYDLDASTKFFVLRQVPSPPNSSSLPQRSTDTPSKIPLGRVLHRLKPFQELDTRSVGTGGTTWEASIVMALYFAAHPEQLHGHVMELGSGVGLGGILLRQVVSSSSRQDPTPSPVQSITLTDGCHGVLAQCRRNIEALLEDGGVHDNTTKYYQNHPDLHVSPLDWHEVLRNNNNNHPTPHHYHNYDTVLACDCAYRMEDTRALVETMKALMRKDPTGKGCVHLFGPVNRAAFQEVIRLLQADVQWVVHVDELEMGRHRLLPSSTCDNEKTSHDNKNQWAKSVSHTTAHFLHVTATMRDHHSAGTGVSWRSLCDID